MEDAAVLTGNGPADTAGVIARLKAMAEEGRTEEVTEHDGVFHAPPVKDMSKPKSFIQKIRDNEVTSEDVSDELREEWVRSILGGIPFSYKIPVLGGRVEFVFAELDKDAAKFARRLNTALGGNLDAQIKLSIVLQLKEVSGEVHLEFKEAGKLMDDTSTDTHPSRAVAKAFDDMCDEMPPGLTRFVVMAWNIYSTLVGILTEDALPDSF